MDKWDAQLDVRAKEPDTAEMDFAAMEKQCRAVPLIAEEMRACHAIMTASASRKTGKEWEPARMTAKQELRQLLEIHIKGMRIRAHHSRTANGIRTERDIAN